MRKITIDSFVTLWARYDLYLCLVIWFQVASFAFESSKNNNIIHVNFMGECMAWEIYICHLPCQARMFVDAIKKLK